MENCCKKIGTFLLSSLIMLTKAVLAVPPGTCRFSPSCSHYAMEAARTFPLHRAIVLIAVRLLKCTPLSVGGFDPVPKGHGKVCGLE
jgi:putative membrane protein insertion efficiency factor